MSDESWASVPHMGIPHFGTDTQYKTKKQLERERLEKALEEVEDA